MALPRQVPRLWPWHVPRFCPWQPPWYQPWQPTGVPRQLPRHIPCSPPRQLPRQSTATKGECHGIPRHSTAILPQQVSWQYAAIATKLHGCCHGITTDAKPQEFPRHSVAFRGFPWHCAAIPRLSSNERQLPPNSTAIATELHGDCHGHFHGKQWHSAGIRGKCHGNPPIRGNCHGTPRQLPRQIHGRQTTVISTAFRGHRWQ